MNKILFSAIIFILIAYIDGSEVIKSKETKKIVAYASIFFTAAILSILLIMGLKIPSPIEPLENFIVSIFGKS